MLKSSQRTMLVLLSVVLAALVAGVILRTTIQNDFQHYVEAEQSALVRLISSELEDSYGKSRKWSREAAAEVAVRALQLGFQMKLVDAHGDAVIDTEQAMTLLPSDRSSRIREAAGFFGDDNKTDYRSYPLSSGKENAGRLDVKFMGKGRSDTFGSRAGIIVLVGFFFTAVTLTLVALFSLNQAKSVGTSVPESADTSAGLSSAIKDETTTETVPLSEKEKTSDAGPALRIAVATEEKQEELMDDPLDADDEDMQPLAGDPDRISRIVKGLDGLAKAQALRGALQKQPLELSPFLNTLIEKARESCPNAAVTFRVECGSDLSMTADPACLSGIMTNLLDNAAKAVKHEGTVTVRASEKGEQIEIAVRDTGCGIRRKALRHIFERFYRGSGDGIGLGLTIVQELVDACKGTIAVQSIRGKGSVFTVLIPRS